MVMRTQLQRRLSAGDYTLLYLQFWETYTVGFGERMDHRILDSLTQKALVSHPAWPVEYSISVFLFLATYIRGGTKQAGL